MLSSGASLETDLEENINLTAQAEPELEATIESNSEEQQSEPETEQPSKLFTQEDLDAAIGKRLSIERRRIERELSNKYQDANKKPANTALKDISEYKDVNEYISAKAEHLAAQQFNEYISAQEERRINEAFEDTLDEARAKFDDFDDTVGKIAAAIDSQPALLRAIKLSEKGAEIAYYLGNNVKEANRIIRMRDPLLQAKELGKIEVKLTESIPNKKTITSAPPPIPINKSSSSKGLIFDTTDPRSVQTMSTEDWIKAEMARMSKK